MKASHTARRGHPGGGGILEQGPGSGPGWMGRSWVKGGHPGRAWPGLCGERGVDSGGGVSVLAGPGARGRGARWEGGGMVECWLGARSGIRGTK